MNSSQEEKLISLSLPCIEPAFSLCNYSKLTKLSILTSLEGHGRVYVFSASDEIFLEKLTTWTPHSIFLCAVCAQIALKCCS